MPNKFPGQPGFEPGVESSATRRALFNLSRRLDASASETALNDLEDVNAPAPGDDQVLTWNTATSKWINQSPAAVVIPDPLLLSDGTATAPSYSFTSSSGGTGMYQKSSNLIGFASNGTECLTVSNNQVYITNTNSQQLILRSSAGTTAGYIGFYKPNGTRAGYMGYPNTDDLYITNENTNRNTLFRTVNSSVLSAINFRVDGTGHVGGMSTLYTTYTTGAGANMYLHPSGYIYRSTSSEKWKDHIEPLWSDLAEQIVDETEWVYYQSICEDDDQDWRHFGAIAEQVALIAPWLVHWGPDDDCGCVQPTIQVDDGEGGTVEQADPDVKDWHTCELVPHGIMYERFVTVLGATVQKDRLRLQAVESELAELKDRLDVLEQLQ